MLGIRFNTKKFYLAFFNLLVLISEVSCVALFGPKLPYNSGLGYGLLGNGIFGFPLPFIPRYGNLGYGGFGWGPEKSTKGSRGKRSTNTNDEYNSIYRYNDSHGDSNSAFSKFKSYVPEVNVDKHYDLNDFYADLIKSFYVGDGERGAQNLHHLLEVPEFRNSLSYVGGGISQFDLDGYKQPDNSDEDDSDSEDSDSEDSDSEDSDSEDSDSDDYDSDSDDYDSDSEDSDNESDSDEANKDSDDEANKDSHDKANHVDLNNIPVSGHYNHLESVKEPNPYDTRTGRTAHTQDSDSDDSDSEDSDDYDSDSDYSDNESDSDDDSNEDSDEANDGSDDSEDSGDEANQDSDKDAEIANVHYGNSEGIVNSSNYVEGNNSQELNSRDSKSSDYYYMRNMNTLARALPDPYVFSPIHSSHNHVDLNDILVSGHYNHLESVEEPNPYDTRTGRTAHTPKQRPVHSSSYTPYDHYGHNNLLVSGHNVPEIGPEEVYSDYETHEYW